MLSVVAAVGRESRPYYSSGSKWQDDVTFAEQKLWQEEPIDDEEPVHSNVD